MKREIWMCVWLYIEIVIVGVISGSSGIADNIWARETQQATCQVIGENLVASASATVTHALEGICTSKEINQYFIELKNDIAIELNDLKSLFLDFTKEVGDYRSKVENEQKKSFSDQSKVSSAPKKPRNLYKLHNSNFFNTGSGKEEFSYIWKVNVSQIKISGLNKLSIMRSPDFYTDWGYRMYIKLFPQQHKGNIYIHVGLTNGQWDHLLQWPFRLKHQLIIQEQAANNTEANDLISQVWDPSVLCNYSYWQKPIIFQHNDECVGFGFNPDNIFTKNYILDGHILIKLNVFPHN